MYLYLLGGYLIVFLKLMNFSCIYSLDWNISVFIFNELYCFNIWSMVGIMVNRFD